MKTFQHLTPLFLPLGTALIFLAGCGPVEEAEVLDNSQEVADYYASQISLPPEVREAFERGEITQEEIDRRTAAGEFEKFFQFKTIEDLPADLTWQNGMDLPDIGSPEAKKGGTRNGRLQDFPRTLRRVGPDSNGSFRPFIMDDTTMQFAHRHPNVTGIGPYGHYYYPGLAKEWAIDFERKTVFVRLDERAKWSDGVPITVDDVFFMFYFFQSPYIKAPWYNNWYSRNYVNVTRYDDHTFSVTVPEAKPDMSARVLELRAVPRHFYRELGDDFVERYQWRFQPTSGPYTIDDKDIKKGDSIVLRRNDEWWAKDNKFWRNRYNFDRIRLTVIRDTEKAFESFVRGDLDSWGLNLSRFWYEKLPADHELVENNYINRVKFFNDVPRPTYGLWMNSSKPYLDNIDVRVGIHHATNWELICEKYFRGDAERMRTSADGYGVFTHPTLQARPFDVELALASFAKAGFTQRGPDGILVNEAGDRLSFELSTGYRVLEDLLTILKEEAMKAGLEFRINVLDGTSGWKLVQEKKHEISFSAFNVSPEMYPRYWETYHSVNAYDQAFLPDGSVNPDRQVKTQTNNLQVIAIPELDKMIERYRASESAEEMIQLAHQMEEMLYEDASFAPGFVLPFYRVGFWRWLRFPADEFDTKLSRDPTERFVNWIDTDLKEATERARSAGEPMEPDVYQDVYDQFRVPAGDQAAIEQN